MSFDTLLIANRGEIACRVIESARARGLRTVAVYSDADGQSRHVALADAAVRLGPAPAAESYLDIARVIEAAKASGAGAIHPGYGFLSENPEFVEAVEAAGLVFVGPSAEAIRAMGLKGEAKARMAAAGVPVVPGYHGDDQSDARLAKEADAIGYPVLIKAVAGGGGKGMRRVDAPSDFPDALASARAEALGAFGNGDVLVEKFVAKPRHIEVQVFGDGTRAVHLFERDCSLQRRHQKVIEEAPAPGMTAEMREAMCSAAVRAAEAVGYSGAGTVEFIVDANDGLRPDRFWFMEMNTRLQVEHPVTEAITGVDLVDWQLRVAAGEPLPFAQEDLSIRGHAFEARIYAEDTGAGFLPATGRLDHLRFPGAGVRVDTGVREGDEITPFYDPMIAKLTVHGDNRDTALAAMARALGETEIAGTVTNIAFLGRLIDQVDVRSGDVETGLIDTHVETLAADPPLGAEALAVAAVEALGLRSGATQGFTLWAPLRHHVTLGEEALIVEPSADGAVVRHGETAMQLRYMDGTWSVDDYADRWRAVCLETSVHVFGPQGGAVDLQDPLARGVDDGAGADVAVAPMPGRVVSVAVGVGDRVTKGDALAVLEAMKMEHRLVAAVDGVVAEVLVVQDEQVSQGTVLVRLEPAA